MDWYLEAFRRYADFSGRSRRSEYWYFCLFNIVIMVAFVAVGYLSGLESAFFVLLGLYYLAALIPSLSVSVRRLHDTDRSGWWLLISAIPLASLVLLVFMIQDSTPGENEYGPNPKEGVPAY